MPPSEFNNWHMTRPLIYPAASPFEYSNNLCYYSTHNQLNKWNSVTTRGTRSYTIFLIIPKTSLSFPFFKRVHVSKVTYHLTRLHNCCKHDQLLYNFFLFILIIYKSIQLIYVTIFIFYNRHWYNICPLYFIRN